MSGVKSLHRKRVMTAAVFMVAIVAAAALWRGQTPGEADWSEAEKDMIASLSLSRLPELPPDPTNAVADNPAAADLGNRLFFDTRLSGNGQFSCATCHQPDKRFTDGLPRAVAMGQARRNTPSLIGAAYSPWQYWDGRRDSQWSQALAPLEDPAEQGSNRMRIVRLVAQDPIYRADYESLFGTPPDFSDTGRFPDDAAPLPDTDLESAWQAMRFEDRQLVNRVFANIGKAIAAYERLLLPSPSRFDAFAQDLAAGGDGAAYLDASEQQGLDLFIGEARCTECHNGPLLTNHEFHNTGVITAPGQTPDRGRLDGVLEVQDNEFNCMGAFSDETERSCMELRFVRMGDELIGAMRTPSLRNLNNTEPYFHKGQVGTLAEVLEHYNQAPLAMIGHNEAEPLGLSQRELRALEAFLLSLDAPPLTDAQWLMSLEK